MESTRIAVLLHPYLDAGGLTSDQLRNISIYIDLLSKWNAKMNLTAVRNPEDMVRRHFGESLFAARNLVDPSSQITAADVGSGAGFPGIPLKIFAPGLKLTLIEAQGKKATFLREVIRTLKLPSIDVFQERADRWGKTADLVVLRAVEKFEQILSPAASLVSPGGRLGLLIGEQQLQLAQKLLPGSWLGPTLIPESGNRVLVIWKRDRIQA
jgi:16S rRNA (guanine527-N7)-methyltransferase